jgi:GDP-L-fucose synthase
MKALVVGGAGFLGRNLVDQLLDIGCECTVVDDDSGLSSARPLPPGVRHIPVEAANISSLLLDRPDYVYYLAATVANVSYSAVNQSEMMTANLRALLGLRACYGLRPRSVVYISSACVYPAEAPVPTSELWGDRGLPEPTNRGYGTAKRVGEQLASILHSETGIPTVIARPFNIYGPWDLYDREVGHFIPALMRKMFDQEREINILGGPQTRAFTYVEDVVDCVVKLSHLGDGVHVVNVGYPEDASVVDVASAIATLLDFKGKLIYSGGPVGHARRAGTQQVIKQLIGNFDWTPLESGLRKTISWCLSKGLAQLPSRRATQK